jgi:hypothetical protein
MVLIVAQLTECIYYLYNMSEMLYTDDDGYEKTGTFNHAVLGAVVRYDAGDMWANASPQNEIMNLVDYWTRYANKTGKLLDNNNEDEQNIEDTWQINIEGDEYYLDQKFQWRPKSSKSRFRDWLARPEIMVPAQQIIEDRWDEVKKLMTHQDEELEATGQKLTLRQRIAIAGFWATEAGIVGYIPATGVDRIALSGSPLAEGIMMGGVAAAGAGYGLFKTRSRRPKKHEAEAQPNPTQLTEEQSRAVWNLCQTLHYSGGELDHWADEITHEELAAAVTVIGSDGISASVAELLKWIDKANFDKELQENKDARPSEEKDQALHYLSTSSSINSEGMNETFHLISKAGRQSAPLSLLALVRMERRGSFMSEYAKEFADVHDKWHQLADLGAEYGLIDDSRRVIGDESEYFNLRREDNLRQAQECRKEMALMDLRIAALAYAYDKNPETLSQRYRPIETEDFENAQLQAWADSVNELCQIPVRELSAPMADVVMATMNRCLDMEKSGQYGKVAQDVVAYVQKIGTAVQDEALATAAVQHIDLLLDRQKALE